MHFKLISFFKKNSRYFFIILILAFGAVYFIYNPATNLFFPACPFKTVTGLDCPGCGSQRAFHELLHLNFRKAFGYNALMVVSIPYVMMGLLFSFPNNRRLFPRINRFLFGLETMLLILGIIVLYFVFRNL
ncbi:DUF2752 domain-containing protein [Chryseobacterium sp. R2A-55]|uniref:DUF2752 domain-containing protein n=1 Tax=Chryseobacterium sp. R2A-55 TaxID=2744445 RepID=UPI00397B0728